MGEVRRDQPYAVFALTIANSLSLLAPVLDEMKRRGWRTKVVCGPTSAEVRQRYPDVDISVIPMSRAITPASDSVALLRWSRLLRRERPDMVIGSTPKAALLSMTAARAARVPTRVFHVRGARWDQMTGRRASLLRAMDRLAALNATHLVAVSPSLADLMVTSGITAERPTVISRGGSKGVDVHRFHPPIGHDHPPTLGYVGRLSQDKGIDDVLTVFEACRAKDPQCILRLIGSIDPAQPISEHTRSRLDQDGVQWLGPRDDVPEQMRQMDVLVFPSIREGLPNVVIEAAACGVPTVAYDVTGVRDAVDDGITGILVPVGDTAALARAARSLLRTDMASTMRNNARAFATQYFAQEDVVAGFANHLDSLLSQASLS